MSADSRSDKFSDSCDDIFGVKMHTSGMGTPTLMDRRATRARAYLETHPWINFRIDLHHIDHRTWLLLGEADSKCQHVAGVPLQPDVAKKLHMIYLSKGIHGTASIEGNTLSEEEVLARVEGDLELPASRAYLGDEIDNIVEACNQIVRDVSEGRPLNITRERIEYFNRQILKNLPLKENVVPGEVRTHSVGVMKYRGAPAEDCEYLLDELCDWMQRLDEEASSAPHLKAPFAMVKAILAHLYIAWIHPFGDGNGRTARLIEFQLLVQAGIPIPAAHLLSDHYNRTRDMYYLELDRTSKGRFELDPFIRYAMQGFVDELRSQLGVIRESQLDIMWEHYVHTSLKNNVTEGRMKKLMLAMPKDQPVLVSELPDLTLALRQDYSARTDRTLDRDIRKLVDRKLLIRLKGGRVVANRDLIKAFLPMRAEF